jgi:methyl-accepting chemotaxis protein
MPLATSEPPQAAPQEARALHHAVSRWTFGAALAGMAVYSIVEYGVDRPADWQNFLLHHLLHVALIGIAVWVASMIVIRRFVIEPVDQIFIHLRRVAAGRLEFLDCAVRAQEVGSVVASVNGLISRLRRIPEPNAVSKALDHLRGLREQLKASSEKLGDDVVPTMRLVTALEGDLLDILQLTDTPPEIAAKAPASNSVTAGVPRRDITE